MVLKAGAFLVQVRQGDVVKLGFLHILILLKIWRRGAFLSLGAPPAPLLGQGAPLRSAFPPLFWPRSQELVHSNCKTCQ